MKLISVFPNTFEGVKSFALKEATSGFDDLGPIRLSFSFIGIEEPTRQISLQ